MAEKPQTLKNHARLFPLFHFFVLPVLLVNVLNTLRHLYLAPSLGTTWGVIVALALAALALAARTMALTVQDRVIRLEMRLRLGEILPPDMATQISELTREQLIALRFASDAELPALVREVLNHHLTTQKAIKERVQNWQADHLRC